MNRLGIDVGGTFTDFVLFDEHTGEIHANKLLTSVENPSQAILAGTRQLVGESFRHIHDVLHATTLATNAVLERKGARTGLITTRGFRDVLSIQRQKRFDIYDLQMEKPEPLVGRELIEEVTERARWDGSIDIPLDEDDARRAAHALASRGVDAIAIVLIHGYRNSVHERRAKQIVEEECPDIRVCTSSEVSPVFREYERASTTVMNAYVMPAMQSYLDELERVLVKDEFRGRFQLMQSNGGLSAAPVVKSLPIRLIESGPAAGVVFAAFYARLAGVPDLLSFDMGGTTAKACLIRRHRPSMTQVFEVARKRMFPGSGLPITIPCVDLVEIGAGGGSIAEVRLGALEVGPESAGANPGPACYGLGGTKPTVTDASVTLGYIDPEYFLGGRMPIDVDASCRAISDNLCGQLNLDLTEAAWGIHRIVNHNMAQALRLVSIERGHDPRDLPVMCFGGGGPLHGARLAQELPSSTVIVPWLAGVTSSIGLLAADTVYESVRTRPAPLESVSTADIEEVFGQLREEVEAVIAITGVEIQTLLVPSVDLRYAGQGYELTLELDTTSWEDNAAQRVRQSYDALYDSIYGAANEEWPVEVVQWRLAAVQAGANFVLRAPGGDQRPSAWKSERAAYFPEGGGWVTCDVFDRYALRAGDTLAGPAIIEEQEATTLVPSGAHLRVDELGSLIITVSPGGA